jgi:Domain of unknown function (DUF4382)
MRFALEVGLPASLLAVAALTVGCSSGQDKANMGSLSVRLAASRPIEGRATDAQGSDLIATLSATDVTISGVEARRSDGTWLAVESGFPKTFDLLALANVGDTITFPGVLIPEGHYTALQVRVADIIISKSDGAHVDISPYGPGWTVLTAVDFDVVDDKSTLVGLNFALDRSITVVNGELAFEPEIDVDGVEKNL